jgi:small-conductance mechanosensitive channel
VQFVNDTSVAIVTPLQDLWNGIVQSIPGIIGAVVVLLIGSFVAVILGHAAKVVLERLRVNHYISKAKLSKSMGHTHVPAVVGELVKWYIIILFLQQAVRLMNLGVLSDFLDSFVRWLPNLVVAAVILLFGLAIAHYLEMKIKEHSRLKGVSMSAKIVNWVVIIIVLIMALKQIGVDVSTAENIFLMIIAAAAGGMALALGIGLGLGLKKEAEGFVKAVKKKL